MKELLMAIYDYLKDTCLSGIVDESVELSDCLFYAIDPEMLLIPRSISFPAIGIKDGTIDYPLEELTTNAQDNVFYVKFGVFVPMVSGDDIIIGTYPLAPRGIFALTDHLKKNLRDNLLGLSGLETALPIHETEIERVGSDDFTALRKILVMRYTQLEQV